MARISNLLNNFDLKDTTTHPISSTISSYSLATDLKDYTVHPINANISDYMVSIDVKAIPTDSEPLAYLGDLGIVQFYLGTAEITMLIQH